MTAAAQPPLRLLVCCDAADQGDALLGRLAGDGALQAIAAYGGAASAAIQRIFSTPARRFLVSGVFGNGYLASDVAAVAAGSDLAIVCVDAAAGITAQTRLNLYLLSIARVPHIAILIDAMEQADYAQARFRAVEHGCSALAQQLSTPDFACLPVSVAEDVNIARAGAQLAWFRGPTLADHLDSLPLAADGSAPALRMRVEGLHGVGQGVVSVRGSVASGVIRSGDRVRIQPSGALTQVRRIRDDATGAEQAAAGEHATLTLVDDVDIARGSLISAADAPAQLADQFDATVVWADDAPLLRGRTYTLASGDSAVGATIAPLKYKMNVQTLEHVAADKLGPNEIGVCELELGQALPFDPYSENRATGSFLLKDRITGRTLGFGMLNFALRRAHNVHMYALAVNKVARSGQKNQQACVLWLTGISASGKSTIANLVDRKLHALGRHTYVLDGDNVRHGLNKDLGFTAEDRVENIRRIAEVAKLMVDAGLIVLTAFISPFRSERRMARDLLPAGEFIEIFVDTPLAVAEQRDPKGLYKKARRGEIKNFTGLDSPYEVPEAAEIRIETANITPEAAADEIIAFIRDAGLLGAR